MKVQKAKQDRTKATDRKAGESRRTRPGRKTTSDEWKEQRNPKVKLILKRQRELMRRSDRDTDIVKYREK